LFTLYQLQLISYQVYFIGHYGWGVFNSSRLLEFGNVTQQM